MESPEEAPNPRLAAVTITPRVYSFTRKRWTDKQFNVVLTVEDGKARYDIMFGPREFFTFFHRVAGAVGDYLIAKPEE